MGSKPILIKKPQPAAKKPTKSTQQNEYTIRMVVYGEFRVGKTSINSKYQYGELNSYYRSNFASQYFQKTIHAKSGQRFKASIFDTQGEERFRFIRPLYFRNAQVIILVFDLTNHQSFVRLDYFIEHVKEFASFTDTVICLVGSKCGLTQQRKTFREEGQKKAKQITNCMYYQTSAQTGFGVDFLFQNAVDRFVKMHTPS